MGAGRRPRGAQNCYSLELNEARINWFNAGTNYAQVVTEAADDAGGQGFVTEMAGPTSNLAEVVWSAGDEQNWAAFARAPGASLGDAARFFGTYDGFWDVVREHVAMPAGVTVDAIKSCSACYDAPLDTEALAALERSVIEPCASCSDSSTRTAT